MPLELLAAFSTLLVGCYLFLEGLRAHRNGQNNAAIVLEACLMLVTYGAAHLLDQHWASAFAFIAGAACLGVLQNRKGRQRATTNNSHSEP